MFRQSKKRKYEHAELKVMVDPEVNLRLYPPLKNYRRGKSYQLSMGDLHANAVKLLYFLVREKVMTMSEKDYLVFVSKKARVKWHFTSHFYFYEL